MNEHTALALLQRGDEAGLRWMIQKYTPYVSAIAWAILRDRLSPQDAEEVTSDAFLALWRYRDRLREGKVKSYLGAAARTRAIDRLRKAGQNVPLEEDDVAVTADTPEREVLLRESRALVRQYLLTMKPTDREIFLRCYYLCESAPAIAERLGMSPDAVRQRLTRGREYLRRMFEEDEKL